MAADLHSIATWMHQALVGKDILPDLSTRFPNTPPLALAEAYQVQRQWVEQCEAEGDRKVGFKAALTTKAMQAAEKVDTPLLGALMGSRALAVGQAYSLEGFAETAIEPEIAIVLKKDLRGGPGLTPLEVRAAVWGCLPAIEVANPRRQSYGYSLGHLVACNTWNGAFLLGEGTPVPLENLDLPREGVVLKINGEVVGSGAGVEVLGDPLRAVAFMATQVAELYDAPLRAGMPLMTGSVIKASTVKAGDWVEMATTHLGALSLKIVP